MDEAPKEKPVMRFITSRALSASVIPGLKIANSVPSPNRPSPTTPSPITEPPAKAMASPPPRLVRAAWVVRTLALVATRMPMNPARAEQKAPQTNETATSGWLLGEMRPPAPSSSATQATKTASTLYSARRKAIAPSEIARAMRCIFSFPGSWRATHAERQKV